VECLVSAYIEYSHQDMSDLIYVVRMLHVQILRYDTSRVWLHTSCTTHTMSKLWWSVVELVEVADLETFRYEGRAHRFNKQPSKITTIFAVRSYPNREGEIGSRTSFGERY